MLKENGLDPMILALLQSSSLDADLEHHDSNLPVTDSNDVEDVLPNHISFSEELRLQGLGKWLERCRFEFGIAVLRLSPIVCSILAFLRSLQAEDLSMTSKPRKCSTIKIEIHFSIILSKGSLTSCLLALDAQCFYYQFLGKIFYIVAVLFYRLDAEHLCWSAAFILKVNQFKSNLELTTLSGHYGGSEVQ
ncbi:hypothetical protein BC332_06275 [Capsicum chinense]|nr:hypothetical protein BC332_06275 [Capsicum chinense]